jgi:spore germination cell wall hydrolase CwlJ-like protein
MAMWVVYILIALTFGAFLGSPVPDRWAGRISEAISEASERNAEATEEAAPEGSAETAETANLHSGTPDGISAADTTATGILAGKSTEVDIFAVSKTAEALVTDDKKSAKVIAADAKTADAGAAGTAEESVPVVVSDSPASGPESVQTPALPQPQPDYIVLNANRGGSADRQEMDVLVHLINAEAYGLSYKAKVAVGQVVMNRWKGPFYGDDLLAIMTAPHQFTPIYNGSAYKKKIESSSIEAANAVLAGAGVKELTGDTYYFVDPDFTTDKTIETKMKFVCEIEGIHFFRPPDKNTD